MSVVDGWRRDLRWATTHRVLLAAVRARARAGNDVARLYLAPPATPGPDPVLAGLHAHRPFVDGAFPGALATGDHAVVRELLARHDFAVPSRSPGPVGRLAGWIAGPGPRPSPIAPPSLLAIDGPEHARLRRLLHRTFSARAVAALREQTEAVAADLLDAMASSARDGAPVDLVGAYTGRLPVAVISRVLGVPEDDLERLHRFGASVAAAFDTCLSRPAFRAAEEGLAELGGWLEEHVDRLRREPGDDLLSRLAAERDAEGARALSRTELVTTAMLVLVAGFETTASVLTGGALTLAANPRERDRLLAEPHRWGGAVEELLRLEAPSGRVARTPVADTTIAGVAVPRGRLVVGYVAAANRDPVVFADPDRFDPDRANAREHLSFALGAHHCLGAGLARMEVEVGLRALFTRFPDLAPAGEPVLRDTRLLRGYLRAPVRLRADEQAPTRRSREGHPLPVE